MGASPHRRPEGVDDATVAALGTLGEALEYVERARGHLYAFHQLSGRAQLVGGIRHLFEAEMKERRRSRGRSGHEDRPPAAYEDQVDTA